MYAVPAVVVFNFVPLDEVPEYISQAILVVKLIPVYNFLNWLKGIVTPTLISVPPKFPRTTLAVIVLDF